MLTVLDLSQEDTQFNRKASTRREKKGPCPDPTCSKRTDGFSVKLPSEGKTVFMCRGCWDPQEILTPETARAIGKPQRAGEKRGWGDEIDYLRHYRKMDYQQARAFVGDPGQVHAAARQVTRATNWQEVIKASVQESEDRLWSEDDTTALDYVRGRGLWDSTIRGAHLGYSVKDGIPRLIIPSYNQGRYVAVYRRDLRADVDHSERWKDVAGSSKDELYLADCLGRRRPTVLVEAPLCTLTIVQECGDLVNVVATAGTDGARNPNVIAQLSLMPVVFMAFDADAAGDKAWIEYWQKRLPNAVRLRPLLVDVNAMFMAGWNIRAWIEQALADQDTAPSPIANTPETPAPLRPMTPCIVETLPTTLKCLSIQQPWSWLIAHGHKDVENRDWSTSYRGPVLIHAGAKVDGDWFIDGQLDDHPMSDLAPLDMPSGQNLYPTKSIVGIATLVDVVESSSSPWFVGRYGFVFADARPFKNPIPYRGQLGLFDVAREIVVSELVPEPAQLPDHTAPDHEEYSDPLNFCAVCGELVDEIIESAGQLVGYCAQCLPKEEDTPMTREQITEAYRKELQKQGLTDWTVEVLTPGEWEAHKQKMARHDRARLVNQSIVRAPMQQWMTEYWIEHGELPDYWTILEHKLASKGYYEAFKATEQALLARVYGQEVAS